MHSSSNFWTLFTFPFSKTRFSLQSFLEKNSFVLIRNLLYFWLLCVVLELLSRWAWTLHHQRWAVSRRRIVNNEYRLFHPRCPRTSSQWPYRSVTMTMSWIAVPGIPITMFWHNVVSCISPPCWRRCMYAENNAALPPWERSTEWYMYRLIIGGLG